MEKLFIFHFDIQILSHARKNGNIFRLKLLSFLRTDDDDDDDVWWSFSDFILCGFFEFLSGKLQNSSLNLREISEVVALQLKVVPGNLIPSKT